MLLGLPISLHIEAIPAPARLKEAAKAWVLGVPILLLTAALNPPLPGLHRVVVQANRVEKHQNLSREILMIQENNFCIFHPAKGNDLLGICAMLPFV